MYSGHKEKATGDQIKSSENAMLCMPSPSRASNKRHLIVLDRYSQKVLKKVQHYRVDVFGADVNAAAANQYLKKQEYHDLYNSSVCFHFERDAARVQHEPPT